MAGTGNRDVQLTITAKNQATAAIDSVAEALKTLAGVQADVAESARGADGLLGDLANEMRNLAAQAKGLDALGTVAGAIDKAAGAVDRLQTQLSSASAENETLRASYAEAAEATHILAAAAANAKTQLEGQRAALASLRAAATRDTAAINAQRAVVTEAAAAWRQLQAQVRSASANENQLDAAVQRSTAAIVKQQAGLELALGNLTEISALGAGASRSLGDVALSQEAIGIASANTAAEIAQVNAALLAQGERKAGSVGGAAGGPAANATQSYRAQVASVQEAREAFTAASAAATELGAAVARADAPTRQLTRDFALAKAASAEAQANYLSQAAALGRLRGATVGSFQAFDQTAVAMERASAASVQSGAGFAEARERLLPMLQAEAEADAKARTLGASLQRLVGILTTIPAASGEAAEGLDRVGSSGHGTLNIFTRMRNELLALTTAYVGFYGAVNAVGGVIKTLETLQSAQQRLAVSFGGDQAQVGAEMEFVRLQAQRLGVDFNTLANEYTRIAIAGHEAGYSVDGTRKIFLAFAEAGRVSGMSTEQLQSAFLGLREMIERGTINARNFNMEIGQQVPGAVQSMAAAIGVSTAKFTAMQKAIGGVAANEETLTRFADILREKFGSQLPSAVQTLQAQLGRFQADMQEAQLAVANGGFAAGLIKALHGLDEEFTNGSADTFFSKVGATMGALAGVIPVVVSNFGALLDVIKVMLAMRVAKFFLDIQRSQALFGVSLAQASGRLDGFLGVLGHLGGESGIVTGAITRLRVALIQTATAFGEMSVSEQLAAARSAAMVGATTMVEVALVGLRGVAIGVTATFEAMWLAVGGIPGIIITALTLLVGSLMGDWIGQLGQANDALTVHEGLMQKVRQAYQDADGDAKALAKTLEGMASIQIEANLLDLKKQLSEERGGPANAAGLNADLGLRPIDSSGASSRTQKQLYALLQAFKNGKLAAEDFKKQVNALAEADPGLDRHVAAQLEDVADKAAKSEGAIKETDAALRLVNGTATEADRVFLGLAGSVTALNGAFDPAALDRYNTALLALKEQIPSYAKAAELEGKIQKVNSEFASAQLDLAGPLASKDPKVKAQADAALARITALKDQAIAEIETKAALEKAQTGGGKRYVDIARSYMGDDKNKNPGALTEFLKGGKDGFTGLAEKWCAAFVNATLAVGGTKGTGSLAAKSFLNYGTDAKADPQPGDIVVIKNKDGSYHVGIYAGTAGGGRLDIVGGNQHGGRVNEESFAASSAVAIRRPPSAAEQERGEEKADTQTEEFHRFVGAIVAAMKAATGAQAQSPRDAFIASKLAEIQKKIDESGPTPENPNAPKLGWNPGERQSVTAAAGAQYDAKEQAEEIKKVASAQLALNALIKSAHGDADQLTQAEFVHNQAIKDGVDLLTKEGQKYAEIQGKIYDLQMQQKAFNAVVGKGQQLQDLGKQLSSAFKEGDGAAQSTIRQQIADIKTQIEAALPAAKVFAATMGDQRMVANLQRVEAELKNVRTNLIDAQTVNNDLATGMVDAIDKSLNAWGAWAQGVSTAHNALLAMKNAFLGFASSFLKEIADMILKQLILNALMKSPIGGVLSAGTNALANAGTQVAMTTGGTTAATLIGTGMATAGATAGATIGAAMAAAGSLAAIEIGAAMAAGGATGGAGGGLASFGLDALTMLHAGGIVGSPGGMSKQASSSIFAGAPRFHTGGFPGLNPGEVPAILQRGEEVLTGSDPRHLFNLQAGRDAKPGGQSGSLKIVNMFEHGEMLSAAMKTDVGERAILNHVRRNRGAWGNAMGVKTSS